MPHLTLFQRKAVEEIIQESCAKARIDKGTINWSRGKSFILGLKRGMKKARLGGEKPGSTPALFEGRCSREVLLSGVSVDVEVGDGCDSKDGRVLMW